jgi:M6 family metalloprotease-like protein
VTATTGRSRRRKAWRAGGIAAALTLTVPVAGAVGSVAPAAAQGQDGSGLFAPLDPEDWVNQADTTWDDYVPVPGKPAGWADGSIKGSVQDFKAAVVLVDFVDQPFLITQTAGSHIFGNPQSGHIPVARSEAAAWFNDYLNTPNESNHGHTITEWWMENSNARYSVSTTAFGPYLLPGKMHEYGLSGFAPVTGASSVCPAGDNCTKSIRTDGFAAWFADQGAEIADQFDVLFWVTAGHDESSTWQEFGEMTFQTQDDVPATFGPPGAEQGAVFNAAGNQIFNWSPTRYVPWTSWRAAANQWPNASGQGGLPNSTQAESSGQGTFQHEMSHLLGIGDNYNNPFATTVIRAYSGYWDMLSRGTFNGPGGTHNRWKVPNAGGSAMGSQFTLRNKMELGLLDPQQVLQLNRADLAGQGVASATIMARSVQRLDMLAGINIVMGTGTGSNSGDLSNCVAEGYVGDRAWLCDRGGYNNYTVEVVDQMGSDSFTPSSGVHIAKTKNRDSAPFVWSIDAQPEDIGLVDFYRPDGTPAMVTLGDPRQTNDALFRAGTDSGSEFEHVEEANRLHFYVLNRRHTDDGVLLYDVAVRNLDGAGDFQRAVSVEQPQHYAVGASTALVRLPLTNTGEAGTGVFGSDVYRITSSIEGDGWSVWQPNEIAAVAAGGSVTVPAFATMTDGAAETATLTMTATSESDPSATVTVTVELDSADVKVSFDSTEALVEAYFGDGLLTGEQRDELLNYLRIIERDRGHSAEQGLRLFTELAGEVADAQTRAVLLSIAEAMKPA